MYVRQVIPTDESDLRSIAEKILVPIYGSQEKAIREWITGEGFKNAFVSCSYFDEITGLLSLKSNSQKPFLKISTLLVVERFRGLNIGTELLCCSLSFAKRHNYDKVIVTVSETKPKVVAFFEKTGFVIVNRLTDKYAKGVTELVMEKSMI